MGVAWMVGMICWCFSTSGCLQADRSCTSTSDCYKGEYCNAAGQCVSDETNDEPRRDTSSEAPEETSDASDVRTTPRSDVGEPEPEEDVVDVRAHDVRRRDVRRYDIRREDVRRDTGPELEITLPEQGRRLIRSTSATITAEINDDGAFDRECGSRLEWSSPNPDQIEVRDATPGDLATDIVARGATDSVLLEARCGSARDTTRIQVTAFPTTLDTPNNPTLWLDASQVDTFPGSGGAIERVIDRGPLGNDFTSGPGKSQVARAHAPELVSSSSETPPSGEPAMRFDGEINNNPDILRLEGHSSDPADDTIQSDALTIAAVLRIDDSGSRDRFKLLTSCTAANIQIQVRRGRLQVDFYRKNISGTPKTVRLDSKSGSYMPYDRWYLLTLVLENGNGGVRSYVDGVNRSSGTLNKRAGASYRVESFGYRWCDDRGRQAFQGELAELVVFDRALKDNLRQLVEQSLMEKYELKP